MAHVRRDRADRADSEGGVLKPRLALLTTGGTIASSAGQRGATTGYALADGGPAALLSAVPELADIADIEAEAFCTIASPDMTPALMLGLAQRLSALLARPDIDGAVVTHGTDTLEETAWLLHLTLRTDKPVVLTGAMRPSSALSADGPMNLLAAVRTAADPAALGRGVLVVVNDRIHGARLVRKAHTIAPDAFRGGEIGQFAAGAPVLTAVPDGRHTSCSQFDATAIVSLPPVEIAMVYPGASVAPIAGCRAGGAAGLVIACTGNGSLSRPVRDAVEAEVAAGLVVVRASRTLEGAVCWTGQPGIPAGLHTPQKARLLLSLALTQTSDPAAIEAVFAAY